MEYSCLCTVLRLALKVTIAEGVNPGAHPSFDADRGKSNRKRPLACFAPLTDQPDLFPLHGTPGSASGGCPAGVHLLIFHRGCPCLLLKPPWPGPFGGHRATRIRLGSRWTTMPPGRQRGSATRGRGGRGRGRGGSAGARAGASRRATSGINDDDDDDELDDDVGDADFKPKHVSKKRGGAAGSVTGRARDKTRKSAPRVRQGRSRLIGVSEMLTHSAVYCMPLLLLSLLGMTRAFPPHVRWLARTSPWASPLARCSRARAWLIPQLMEDPANDERELAARLKHLGLYAANTWGCHRLPPSGCFMI